jgi:hypothetical protein
MTVQGKNSHGSRGLINFAVIDDIIREHSLDPHSDSRDTRHTYGQTYQGLNSFYSRLRARQKIVIQNNSLTKTYHY